MSKLFNYEGKFVSFINRIYEFIVLSALWFICSIPLITIGASTTAMYYVVLKSARDEEGYTIRSFFNSFKSNFKQATIIWIVFLIGLIILGCDVYYFVYVLESMNLLKNIFIGIIVALLLLWFLMFQYVFAILARFNNTTKQIIYNAFVLVFRHLSNSLVILVTNAVIIYLCIGIMPIFCMPFVIWINSFMLHKIFQNYIE